MKKKESPIKLENMKQKPNTQNKSNKPSQQSLAQQNQSSNLEQQSSQKQFIFDKTSQNQTEFQNYFFQDLFNEYCQGKTSNKHKQNVFNALNSMIQFFQENNWNKQIIKKYCTILFKNQGKPQENEFQQEIIQQYYQLFNKSDILSNIDEDKFLELTLGVFKIYIKLKSTNKHQTQSTSDKDFDFFKQLVAPNPENKFQNNPNFQKCVESLIKKVGFQLASTKSQPNKEILTQIKQYLQQNHPSQSDQGKKSPVQDKQVSNKRNKAKEQPNEDELKVSKKQKNSNQTQQNLKQPQSEHDETKEDKQSQTETSKKKLKQIEKQKNLFISLKKDLEKYIREQGYDSQNDMEESDSDYDVNDDINKLQEEPEQEEEESESKDQNGNEVEDEDDGEKENQQEQQEQTKNQAKKLSIANFMNDDEDEDEDDEDDEDYDNNKDAKSDEEEIEEENDDNDDDNDDDDDDEKEDLGNFENGDELEDEDMDELESLDEDNIIFSEEQAKEVLESLDIDYQDEISSSDDIEGQNFDEILKDSNKLKIFQEAIHSIPPFLYKSEFEKKEYYSQLNKNYLKTQKQQINQQRQTSSKNSKDKKVKFQIHTVEVKHFKEAQKVTMIKKTKTEEVKTNPNFQISSQLIVYE